MLNPLHRCTRLTWLAGAAAVLALAGPAHGGDKNPYWEFKDKAAKDAEGAIVATLLWTPTGKKIGQKTQYTIDVAKTTRAADVRADLIKQIKADKDVSADYDVQEKGNTVLLTPKPGQTPKTPLKPAAETKTKINAKGAIIPIACSGGIDPTIGTAEFGISATGSDTDPGFFTIGLEGKEYTTLTFEQATGQAISPLEVQMALLVQLKQVYQSRATFETSTGLLRVTDVSTGDPYGTGDVDVGASFYSDDPDLVGYASMEIVPSPGALVIAAAGGLLVARRKR